MEALQNAIDKLDREAAEEKGENTAAISDYLHQLIRENPAYAQYIVAEDKTLKGCLGHIRKEARALAQKGMAMVKDTTVYGWVKDYYGIQEEKEKKHGIINLEDFL
jgi:hypothetical protein